MSSLTSDFPEILSSAYKSSLQLHAYAPPVWAL